MRPKILTPALENWLILNYSTKSNETIAQELSEKIRAQYRSRVEDLTRTLSIITCVKARQTILSQIRRMENFKDVSVDFVKKNAKRLKCAKKSSAYISKINRERITQNVIRKWKDKAEFVPQPFSWFRTLEPKRSYFVKFDSDHQLQSFKSSLCNYNRNEGPNRGATLVPDYYKEELLAKINVYNC